MSQMCAHLILGVGALCMTQVNWASSPATYTAFLILFTNRGGTKRIMSKNKNIFKQEKFRDEVLSEPANKMTGLLS